jgi:hypothetical protein
MENKKTNAIADSSLTESKPAEKKSDVHDPVANLGGLPTVEQLALIAATLARNTADFVPYELTKKAMGLWYSARAEIYRADIEGGLVDQDVGMHIDKSERAAVHAQKVTEPFTPAGQYPVTRDVFLRTVLRKYKSRTAELARIAKAYIRDTLHEGTGREPTADEIADTYGRWKPYENAAQANAEAMAFEKWYSGYKINNKRRAGKASALKKRKKML